MVHWGRVARWVACEGGCTLINIQPNTDKSGEYLIKGGATDEYESWTWFEPPICSSTLDEYSDGRVVDILKRSYVFLGRGGTHPKYNPRLCVSE